MPSRPWLRTLLLVALAAGVALASQGYGFDTSDQAIHLTILRERLSPGGLEGDLVAAHADAHQSLFWDLQAPVVAALGWARLPALYLGLWAVALVGAMAGLAAIASALGLGARATALGLLLLAVPRACPGHVFTWEPELINRTAAQPLLLFAIASLLRGRLLVAGLLTGLAFDLHATTAVHTGAALGLAALLDPALRRRVPALIAGFAVGAAPLLARMHGGDALWVDEAWREILRIRMSHHLFPQSWPLGVWAAAALQLGLLGWGLGGLTGDARRRVAGLALGLLAVGPGLGTLAATAMPLAPLLALHLWEAWIGVAILGFLAAAGRAEALWAAGARARVAVAAGALLLLASPEARWMDRARAPEWSVEGDPERAVLADAVARRTRPGEALLVEPGDLEWLRWRAHRPLYVTTKDGGEAVFSRAFALSWRARLTEVAGVDPLTQAEPGWRGYLQVREAASRAFAAHAAETLSALAAREGIRWLVTRADTRPPKGARRDVATRRYRLWKLPTEAPKPAQSNAEQGTIPATPSRDAGAP